MSRNLADNALAALLIASGAAALGYVGICLALYSYQAKLIFRPLPHLINTPAEAGVAYEDVWIPVGKGEDKLHGWWLPNPGSDRVFMFCHGNYGNISYNTERIRFHHSLGFSVFAFDYRGYGLSTGAPPSEEKTYEDAEAAWHYLTAQRQIAPEKITVCGHSMGGAIAIDLASRHPEMANLIVKSTFTTMKDAVDERGLYRMFPIETLLSHPFDSLSKVHALQMPVLYVHGEQDFDVPAKFSKALFAATPEPKQIWLAPEADHNNISARYGDTYGAVIQEFCLKGISQPKQLQSV
ncbi:MAG: alpha/beta fold hydrolase [Cyanobacteria bacterium J06614_10]